MKTLTRRSFMALAASTALAKSIRAQDPVGLTGYSPGNVLSKIDGLELLNLWGDHPSPGTCSRYSSSRVHASR